MKNQPRHDNELAGIIVYYVSIISNIFKYYLVEKKIKKKKISTLSSVLTLLIMGMVPIYGSLQRCCRPITCSQLSSPKTSDKDNFVFSSP